MCKYYTTLFSCFCVHDVKITKPCDCSQERFDASLCDIFQPAKEPVVVKDMCAVCALLGPKTNREQRRPETVADFGRYYQLADLEGLQEYDLYHREMAGRSELAVVLKSSEWEALVEMVEALSVAEVAGKCEENVEVEANADEGIPAQTFAVQLTDRTRKEYFVDSRMRWRPFSSSISVVNGERVFYEHVDGASGGILRRSFYCARHNDTLQRAYIYPLATLVSHPALSHSPHSRSAGPAKTNNSMCKFYETYHSCGCAHDVKVIKPCACYHERDAQTPYARLCAVFQHAKEPVILKDLCSLCQRERDHLQPSQAFFAKQSLTRSTRPGKFYESTDLRDVPVIPVVSHLWGEDAFALLEPESFDSMFKLREVLPDLNEDKRGNEKRRSFDAGDEAETREQSGLDREDATGSSFTTQLADRTRR